MINMVELRFETKVAVEMELQLYEIDKEERLKIVNPTNN